MKNTRKLIPALAMLLVSAVMMSTASFAWFSMNSNVSATGMQVKAATSKNLVISNATDGPYAISAPSDSLALTNMSPATSSDGTSFAYASKAADSYESSAVTGLTTDQLQEVADNNTTYVFKDTFYVKSENDSFSNFYVNSLSVTNSGDLLAGALRVSVTANGNTHIYAVNDESIYKAGKNLQDTTISKFRSTSNDSPSFGAIGTDAVEVTVRIWFEGQDADCTSKNAAVQTANYSIDIFFHAE